METVLAWIVGVLVIVVAYVTSNTKRSGMPLLRNPPPPPPRQKKVLIKKHKANKQ